MADDPKSSDPATPSDNVGPSDPVGSPDPVEAAISAASAAGRKRRPPTLDLTATDTTPPSESPASESAGDPPPPDAVVESPVAAEAVTPESSQFPFAPDTNAPDASASDTKSSDTVTPEPFAAGEQLPPPPASPPPAPPHRGSFGGAMAAGAFGAVLMLLVLGMLWFAGLFSGDNTMLTERTTRLETQLRALSERPAATPGAPAFDSAKLDDLTKRLATLEAAKPPAPDAALTGRIASLENTIKTLSGRLDATATTAREAAQQSAAPSASPAELEALTARVSTVERAAKAIQDDVAKRFSAGLADPAARRAVAADALRAAVERGEPFATQLKAAGNAEKLAPLQPFAATGVPTQATLARELTALLPALRDAQPSAPAGDEATFMQRLASNAEKLVRVRPIHEAAGDDPAATLSRVEARARSADIDGALAELAKLPADARAPAEAWMKKAQGRRDAVQAARQFAAESLNQLAP